MIWSSLFQYQKKAKNPGVYFLVLWVLLSVQLEAALRLEEL